MGPRKGAPDHFQSVPRDFESGQLRANRQLRQPPNRSGIAESPRAADITKEGLYSIRGSLDIDEYRPVRSIRHSACEAPEFRCLKHPRSVTHTLDPTLDQTVPVDCGAHAHSTAGSDLGFSDHHPLCLRRVTAWGPEFRVRDVRFLRGGGRIARSSVPTCFAGTGIHASGERWVGTPLLTGSPRRRPGTASLSGGFEDPADGVSDPRQSAQRQRRD